MLAGNALVYWTFDPGGSLQRATQTVCFDGGYDLSHWLTQGAQAGLRPPTAVGSQSQSALQISFRGSGVTFTPVCGPWRGRIPSARPLVSVPKPATAPGPIAAVTWL